MYEELRKVIMSKYNVDYLRFMDFDEGANAYYVRFIYRSTIHICERRKIGGSTKFYKMECVK